RSNSVLASSRSNLPHILQNYLGKAFPGSDILETQAIWRECIALAEIARAVLEKGQGGTILIVPDDSDGWATFLNPFPYRLAVPDTTIRDLIRRELNNAQTVGQ